MSINLNSKEIETRVVAALMILEKPDSFKAQIAMLNLDESSFFHKETRDIYLAIKHLFDNKLRFCVISVLAAVTGAASTYINECIKPIFYTTSCLDTDIGELNRLKVLRSQLDMIKRMACFDSEATNLTMAEDLINDGIQALHDNKSATTKQYTRTYEQIANDMLEAGEECQDSEFQVNIPGLPDVPNKSLIVIAGRSGHGKTFFGLYLMDKIIDVNPDKQTLYFNLEMHEQVMMERHANLIGIKCSTRYKTIEKALPVLLGKNVSLISEPMITIEQIEAECRLASSKQPISVIVVDYLGLIQSKKKHDRSDLEQANIAKRLAALSLELNCVVIALTQVNRENKVRQIGDKCPIPTDSAESMGSVHSASWWIGIDQPQKDTDEPEFKDLFQAQCRKNRGKAGLFKLDLQFKDGMFSPWVRPYQYEPVKGPKTF